MNYQNGMYIITEIDFQKKYTKSLRLIILVFSLYLPITILGFNNFSSENDAVWFQRSGSLLVFLSVLIHFLSSNFLSFIDETLIDYGNGVIKTNKEYTLEKHTDIEPWRLSSSVKIIFNLFILQFATIGTIIWGYGDLIYGWF